MFLLLYIIGHRSWRKRRPAAQSSRICAAPPALCPRVRWSFIFEFTKTIEKHPRQNYVSWPVGVAGVGVPAQGRGRRILDIGGIEYQ